MASPPRVVFTGPAYVKKKKYKRSSFMNSLSPALTWKKRVVQLHGDGKLLMLEKGKVKEVIKLSIGSTVKITHDEKGCDKALVLTFSTVSDKAGEITFFPESTTTNVVQQPDSGIGIGIDADVDDKEDDDDGRSFSVQRRLSVGAQGILEQWKKWLNTIIKEVSLNDNILNQQNDSQHSLQTIMNKKQLTSEEAMRIKQMMMLENQQIIDFTPSLSTSSINTRPTLEEILADCERMEREISREIINELYGIDVNDNISSKNNETVNPSTTKKINLEKAKHDEALIHKMLSQKTLTETERKEARELMMRANGVTRPLLSSPTIPLNIARKNLTAHSTAYEEAVTVEALEADLDRLILSPQNAFVKSKKKKGKMKEEERRPMQNAYEGESLEEICRKKSITEGEVMATKIMMETIVGESTAEKREENREVAKAAFPFTAIESWQISMDEKDSNIQILEKHADGWTKIKKQDGSEGCVPADFLKE